MFLFGLPISYRTMLKSTNVIYTYLNVYIFIHIQRKKEGVERKKKRGREIG